MPVSHKRRNINKISKSSRTRLNIKSDNKTQKHVKKMKGGNRFSKYLKKKFGKSNSYSLYNKELHEMLKEKNEKKKHNNEMSRIKTEKNKWDLVEQQYKINEKREAIEKWKENKIDEVTQQAKNLHIDSKVGYFNKFLDQDSSAKECKKTKYDEYNLTVDIYKKDINGKYIEDPCKFFQWIYPYEYTNAWDETDIIYNYYAVSDIEIYNFVTNKDAEEEFYKNSYKIRKEARCKAIREAEKKQWNEDYKKYRSGLGPKPSLGFYETRGDGC